MQCIRVESYQIAQSKVNLGFYGRFWFHIPGVQVIKKFFFLYLLRLSLDDLKKLMMQSKEVLNQKFNYSFCCSICAGRTHTRRAWSARSGCCRAAVGRASTPPSLCPRSQPASLASTPASSYADTAHNPNCVGKQGTISYFSITKIEKSK